MGTGRKCHPDQGWEDLTLGALKTTTWKRDRHRNEVETDRNQESHRN